MNSVWVLNSDQVFTAPGASLTIFHDFYPEGHQGGISLLLHGERLMTNGDLRLAPTPGQWDAFPVVGERRTQINAAGGSEVAIPLRFADKGLDYTIRVWGEGEALFLALDLDEALSADDAARSGFNLELYPAILFEKSYQLGSAFGIFPRQNNGPLVSDAQGMLRPVPLATGEKLVIAAEDPRLHCQVTRLGGKLELYDGRDTEANGWFVLRAPLAAGAQKEALILQLLPHRIPGWVRPPQILYSQVGFHPQGEKRFLIELDPARLPAQPGQAILEAFQADGRITPVATAELSPARSFLCYEYVQADFSAVRLPGLYRVRYGEQTTLPFPIADDVYQRGVWQPTLETHLPVQMCHVKVVDGMRIWHGACHLDDALVAPLNTEHFDSYRQYGETETKYQPLEHVPHLNRGGWHDAGDFDLAAGSQASTTMVLALAYEAFGLQSDQTTVDAARQLVILHQPDGIPDLVQQVAHGVENLLSSYRAGADHSYIGIIEDSLKRYALLGDTASMTDNRVYDPTLSEGVVSGDFSGTVDDRWVFTTRHTALEYKVIATLAASSRVLRQWDEALADECLQTALAAWEREQSRPVADAANCYVPRPPEVQEVLAAMELFITTGNQRFRDHFTGRWDVIEANPAQVLGTAARALPFVNDAAFKEHVRQVLQAFLPKIQEEYHANPFGLPFRPHVWGVGWSIQSLGVQGYYLHRAFPELVERSLVMHALEYVLGCHPASNTSLVSGVGAHSLTTAYGTNRAEWSYIPGGIASGPNLIRPNFPELKEPFPFLWQQAEYVIGGAATYLFLVLAADQLLNAAAA